MLVDVWIDFLCPWAYLGQDRSQLLRELGFEVRSRPFELHPEIPTGGRAVDPDGRLAAVYERIDRECASVGLPFRAPRHVANTRSALEWAEGVAMCDPERHPDVVAGLMAASFADGLDVGDVDVIRGVVSATGTDVDAVAAAVERGEASASVDRSMTDAREIGVAATPAWRFPAGFVLPGVQPREQVERWARRLAERAEITPD